MKLVTGVLVLIQDPERGLVVDQFIEDGPVGSEDAIVDRVRHVRSLQPTRNRVFVFRSQEVTE